MLIITDSSSASGTQIIGVLKDSNSQFDVPYEPGRVVLYNYANRQGVTLTKVASDPTGMQWSYADNKVYLGFSLSQGDTVVAYAAASVNTLMRSVPTLSGSTAIEPSSEDPNRRTKLARLTLSMQTIYYYIESVTFRVSEMFANSSSGVTLELAPDENGQPGTFSNQVTVKRIAYGTDRYVWLKQTVQRDQQVQSGVLHMLEATYAPIRPPVSVVEYNSQDSYITRKVPMPWYAPHCLPVARVTVQPYVSLGTEVYPHGASIVYNPLTGEYVWSFSQRHTRYIELQFLPMLMTTFTRIYANTNSYNGIRYTTNVPLLPIIYTTQPYTAVVGDIWYDSGNYVIYSPINPAYLASNNYALPSQTISQLNSAYQGRNVLQYVCPPGTNTWAYPQFRDGQYAFGLSSRSDYDVKYAIYEL